MKTKKPIKIAATAVVLAAIGTAVTFFVLKKSSAVS